MKITLSEKNIREILTSENIPYEQINAIISRLKLIATNGEVDEGKIIKNCPLSTSVIKALNRAGIYTEYQLKRFVSKNGMKGLKAIRNIGEVRIMELIAEFPWMIEKF